MDMEKNIFSSCEQYLFKPLDHIKERPARNADMCKQVSPSLLQPILRNNNPANEALMLDSILELIDLLKFEKNADFLGTSAISVLHDLLPLINYNNEDIKASAYVALLSLSDFVDEYELAEEMMHLLTCVDWKLQDADACYSIARLSTVQVELLGKSLAKITDARNLMLFLPFIANYIVMNIDLLVSFLVHESSFGSSNQPFSSWDKIFILLSNSCLDVIEFIHSKTVKQDPSLFPFNSTDIGKENGDTKRRYLGYFLLNLLFDKVIANFDMQLSDTYFMMNNPVYANRIQVHKRLSMKITAQLASHEPMYDIVHRTLALALTYGLSFQKMHQLQMSLFNNANHNISSEDAMIENEKQTVNYRLYPMSFNGIAVFLSLSLYDKVIYPKISSKPSMGLFDDKIDVYRMAQQYIGITLNLTARCSEYICETDKGVFTMLYIAEHLEHVKMALDDLDKMVPGPCLGVDAFPAAKIIEVISSLASSCPDSTIRFITYKLIERFINYGDEKVQLFVFEELLVRCPFPSMKVAAAGLLKDHVCKTLQEDKISSVFASPAIVTEFVPIILHYKSEWETNHTEFWNDYSYIMQALAFYRTLYHKDACDKRTALWDTVDAVNSIYFEPLSSLLDKINAENLEKKMQIETMKHQVGLIQSEISSQQH